MVANDDGISHVVSSSCSFWLLQDSSSCSRTAAAVFWLHRTTVAAVAAGQHAAAVFWLHRTAVAAVFWLRSSNNLLTAAGQQQLQQDSMQQQSFDCAGQQ
jgi:hypothetical protein